MLQESSPPSSLSPWWTVVAGGIGCGLGAGVLVIYTFGVLASAMAADFGWSRAVHANSLTVFLVFSGLGSLFLGPSIDRLGVRLPCAALVSVFGVSVASLGLVPANPWAVYLIFAIIGLSGSAATAMPYAVAVRSLFDQRRGLALGLVNFGSGVGSAIAPYCARALLDAFSWRGGFVAVGVAGLAPVLGLVFLVREPVRMRSGQATGSQEGLWLAQVRRPTFWLIAIPIAGISIATFGALGSMVPLLKDRGLGAASIAAIMSAAGASSWIARPVAGYALDRFFAPFVTAGTFVFAVFGLVLLAITNSVAGIVIAAILIGFTLGSEGDLVTFLVSRYYGPAVYSRVLGALWVTWAWGGGIGTFVAGASYRVAASYTPALIGFAALLTLCTIIICRLGPYDYPAAGKAPRGFSSAESTG
jgi:predicted MFS family arabinose efflux permease